MQCVGIGKELAENYKAEYLLEIIAGSPASKPIPSALRLLVGRWFYTMIDGNFTHLSPDFLSLIISLEILR